MHETRRPPTTRGVTTREQAVLHRLRRAAETTSDPDVRLAMLRELAPIVESRHPLWEPFVSRRPVRKTPLSTEQWAEVGLQCRVASEGLRRVRAALLRTETAAVCGRWDDLERKLDHATTRLFVAREELGHGRPDGSQVVSDGGPDRANEDHPRPIGGRKPPLTKGEWVAVGREVKECESSLFSVATMLRPAFSQSFCRPWESMLSRLDDLKASLSATINQQHNLWDQADLILYDHPTVEDTKLWGAWAEGELDDESS